ncbi:MAG: SynChlorMet cassette protein ScmC [Chloroflexi bacterium]|nr:SynChlorMet cassette protein ScmC [Chloroflexota bacterium]MBU1751141.1 SynChlorMet cassette protein ScmC [Chloroflexota bacterium]MBU1877971.1 SynChlorMet cassette protein ScmC [Chloroflexota bacterium]
MNLTDRPIPSPGVVLRADFGDYALLFHPLFDDLVGLSPVALATWRALDGRRTVSEIAALVRAQFDGAPESVAEDVVAFLSDLTRRGFVLTEPERPGDAGTRRHTSSPRPPVPPSPHPPVTLVLADGSRLLIRAGDEPAARVVAQFAASASLTLTPLSLGEGPGVRESRLLVVTEGHAVPKDTAGSGSVCVIQAPGREPELRSGKGRGAGLALRPLSETEWLWQQLARLSAFIGKEVQTRGGVLLHSALALLPSPSGRGDGGEGGVLMAGRSGVGKTTASIRLPPPWRALCDDVTLVVRDDKGAPWWAHPWPTWSRLFGKHADDRWDVQAAVPLRAIFVVDQAAQDRTAPAGAGEAVGLLLEVARQASRRLWVGATPDELRAFNAQRFENLCTLVQAIPVYLLDVSLEGTFWEEMARVL